MDQITNNTESPNNLANDVKREIIRYLILFSASVLIAATAFYFNTSSSVKAHEIKLEQLQRQIESKADQGQIEKRLDRMENKLDKLIEQQMK